MFRATWRRTTRNVLFRKKRRGMRQLQCENFVSRGISVALLRTITSYAQAEPTPALIAALSTSYDHGVITCRRCERGLDAFVVEHMLSEEECASLRREAEQMGYSFWNPGTKRRPLSPSLHSIATRRARWVSSPGARTQGLRTRRFGTATPLRSPASRWQTLCGRGSSPSSRPL